jgi:hypothetical protein
MISTLRQRQSTSSLVTGTELFVDGGTSEM